MLHLLHKSFSQRSLLFSFVKLFNEEKIYKFRCLWCSRRNLTNREYRKNRIQNKKFSLFLVFAVWQNNVATNWCTKVNLCTKCGVNAPCCQQQQQTFVDKGKKTRAANSGMPVLAKRRRQPPRWTHWAYRRGDGIRRQGKSRRVGLGGRMCSIPFRASCFASVDLKEKDEFNRFFQIDQLNSTVSSKYTKAKQL